MHQEIWQAAIHHATMERKSFEIYSKIVSKYHQLLQSLYQEVEHITQPVELIRGDDHFIPTATTIAQQIREWPPSMFLYPPTAWVEPRKGSFSYRGILWTYAFHGGGLSFLHSQQEIDVSGEFSRNGELGITEHTTNCHIEDLAVHIHQLKPFVTFHAEYFNQLVLQHIITEVAPFFEGDDQTYSFV